MSFTGNFLRQTAQAYLERAAASGTRCPASSSSKQQQLEAAAAASSSSSSSSKQQLPVLVLYY
jgi:hypothetical protein